MRPIFDISPCAVFQVNDIQVYIVAKTNRGEGCKPGIETLQEAPVFNRSGWRGRQDNMQEAN